MTSHIGVGVEGKAAHSLLNPWHSAKLCIFYRSRWSWRRFIPVFDGVRGVVVVDGGPPQDRGQRRDDRLRFFEVSSLRAVGFYPQVIFSSHLSSSPASSCKLFQARPNVVRRMLRSRILNKKQSFTESDSSFAYECQKSLTESFFIPSTLLNQVWEINPQAMLNFLIYFFVTDHLINISLIFFGQFQSLKKLLTEWATD